MPLDRETSPIGRRLQQLREFAGVSARELDRLAEITEGHFGLIESGVVKNVSAETVAKIAKALGVTTDWLITGSGRVPSARRVKSTVEAARAARLERTGTDG